MQNRIFFVITTNIIFCNTYTIVNIGATFCDSSDGTFLGTNDDDHSVTIYKWEEYLCWFDWLH